MNRHYSCLLLVLALPLAGADKDKPAWQGPDQPVYVITQNHYAEGFTPDGETARFSDLLAIEIYNPKTRPANQDAHYEVGGRLSVFFGGEKQGQVRINKVAPLQCDSTVAIVAPEPSVRLAKDGMALATNAGGVIGHANHQRKATDQEKELAIHLAMSEFEKHGVLEKEERNVEVDQMLVTKIDQNEGELLIAYVHLKATGAFHEVFLVASLKGPKVETELARYHETKDIEDGTDSEDYRFVDQLDLDGDGIDEIVVEVTGYESEEFRILKRLNGAWGRVHVGGQGGC